MKDWWIRFGCFLTGYNYGIVKNSSEVAAKAVKRYTSALLIVCIMWSFIGYTFTQRYLEGGLIESLIGAAILVIVIIQIERQIILSINPTRWLYFSRGVIAMMMAVIGAAIIDQIIFKEDIELEKVTFIETRVKKALPSKTEILRNQIADLDTAIKEKEHERLQLIADVEKQPFIKFYDTKTEPIKVTSTEIDSLGRPMTSEKIESTRTITSSSKPNPKIDLIPPLERNIETLRNSKSANEGELLNVRNKLETEIKSKVGFLDELEVMYALITRSKVAMGVWLLWFFFLLGLELLVLLSKANEKENDYDRTVMHHMDLQMRKLDVLAKLGSGSS